MTPSTLVLKRLEFFTEQAIAKNDLAHLCEIIREDDMAWQRSAWSDEFVLKLYAAVWCKDLKTETHRYPTTWWDAAKARWLPEWSRHWFPVRMTTVEVTNGTVYPSLPTVGEGRQYGEMILGSYVEDGREEP